MTRKFTLLILLFSGLLCASCAKDDATIFTQLSVRLVMPDSRPVERLEILSDLSYFFNVNTYERIVFPAATQNSAEILLRKGVYTLIVEADATYANGDVKRLRAADYNQSMQAVTWTGDAESVVLLLKTVN